MPRKLQLLLVCLALILPIIAVPSTGAQCPTSYTVVTGDTLFSISQRFGVTMDAIAAANGIVDYNRVNIAQTLCIPTGAGGGTFGTGGPVTNAPATNTVTNTTGGSTAISGTVLINETQSYPVATSTALVFPAGAVDPESGFPTKATIVLDSTNNIMGISGGGNIPNSWVAVFVSSDLGDLSGGRIGVLKADATGYVDGFVYIPFLSGDPHQYVMVRSWDGRLQWGYFDMPRRFP